MAAIEKIIREYLDTELDVACLMEIPAEDIPDSFVIVEKTGSGEDEHLYQATIALKSYAPTLYLASELNEQVKEAMDGIIELDRVTKSQLNSDYNYTDTATKKYRYQAVYDITHY